MQRQARPKRAKRRNQNPASLNGNGAPIRVVLDGPESNQLVKEPVFPLSQTLNTKVFNLVATYEAQAVHVSSAAVPTFVAFSFVLSNFDKATSYEAVFDQYRIVMVETTWIPGSTTIVSGGNSGLFTTVIDYDDDTALTTIGNALDYASALTTDGITRHKRTFRPHIAAAVYSGAFTSFANLSGQWIDCASPAVKHYGIKSAWSVTTNVYSYDLIIRAHLQFRNTR